MKIKTFYAANMAEALQLVKREFGSDALILSSKESAKRSVFGLPGSAGVEVVAAVDTATDRVADRCEVAKGGVEAGDAVSAAVLAGSEIPGRGVYSPSLLARSRSARQRAVQLDGEYNEMRRMLYSLTRPAALTPAMFADVVAYEVYQDMVSNEVNDWLAYKLIDEAQRELPEADRKERAKLSRSVNCAARKLVARSPHGDGLPGKRVVALLGPTGVGKTTAIAKLGARLALEQKKKVMLVTLDSNRIGAAEQLKTYAGLMGLPFRALQHGAELAELVREQAQRDYILVDTAGRNQRDTAAVGELSDALQDSLGIERHLVLSATTKAVDMQEIVDRFGVCGPDHLLFTKLDETSTFGPIFNELVRTRKPLSYLSDGQRVPEDLHAVRGEQFVDIIFNP